MTKREAAIVSAYTGFMLGDFSEMQQYAEELFGYPIFSHQFGNETLVKELRDLSRKDFTGISVVGYLKLWTQV